MPRPRKEEAERTAPRLSREKQNWVSTARSARSQFANSPPGQLPPACQRAKASFSISCCTRRCSSTVKLAATADWFPRVRFIRPHLQRLPVPALEPGQSCGSVPLYYALFSLPVSLLIQAQYSDCKRFPFLVTDNLKIKLR